VRDQCSYVEHRADERVSAAMTATNYEITVRGRLSRTLTSEFEQLDLMVESEPARTVVHGSIEDLSALYGLLRRIEALGLELIEVHRAKDPCKDAHTAGGA
jgi:hypothetical protein